MAESGAHQHYHIEAKGMLDTFASAGATHFDITWTNAAGEKQQFRRSVTLADLQRPLPRLLDDAIQQHRNIIVRPHSKTVSFVQLDDLKADRLAAVASVSLLTLETSPRNWVPLLKGT